jgi:hypothetical protein
LKHLAPLLVLSVTATAALAPDDVILPFAQVPFVKEAPDQPQTLGALWGDRAQGPAGTYLRTPGGFVAPLHTHTADYRAVVIKGIWSHWIPERGQTQGTPLPPGSYWTQKAGQPHKDACLSRDECVILLLNQTPYATRLVQ